MPDEDPKERVDRELIELLNEIRVALPGVQVLFAFLLILPFQQTFADTTSEDKAVYALALLASALATAMLIAPSMYHRLNFRGGRKEQMLFDSNKLLIAGTMLTGVGVACAVFLVVDVVYGGTAAMVATLVVVVVYAVAWIALPLLRRGDDES
jgi:peptidoglycan biosynthesis protein MviN/MurJ (putative lipid II flippase)